MSSPLLKGTYYPPILKPFVKTHFYMLQWEKTTNVVIQLLEKEADIKQNDCCHKTLILLVIESDNGDILTLLKNAGANVHYQT